MKRFLLLAAAGIAALAFALPVAAGTVSFRGLVVAKNPVRKTIVTVSRNGTVRTIRARGALRRAPVGRIVAKGSGPATRSTSRLWSSTARCRRAATG